MDRSDLATRMKKYEAVSKSVLMNRMPVIIRIDGRAFHTFTRGFKKPFDEVLIKTMQETTKYLCENIQGCVLGYTQSDEISLVLIDYQKLETSAWFDYEVQKMCSIVASMATMKFNQEFAHQIRLYEEEKNLGNECEIWDSKKDHYYQTICKAMTKGAMFDARVFNIPKEEVTNCIYWRQLDASRNSIQMVGQANFTHKELQKKSCNDIQDMLMTQKGINWNDLPIYQKRGSCVVRMEEVSNPNEFGDEALVRPHWTIDTTIPIFKGEGREYIEKLVMVGE